jgi:hypothetical protein
MKGDTVTIHQGRTGAGMKIVTAIRIGSEHLPDKTALLFQPSTSFFIPSSTIFQFCPE